MKNFILITILLISMQLSADELAWVDHQIEAIKPPRKGLETATLASVSNPFIFLKKKESKDKKKGALSSDKNIIAEDTIVVEEKFTPYLKAIINKSALINGKWYKLHDKVNGYKLSKIQPSSVVLTKNTEKLVLSTKSANKNLNFKNHQ
jgi:hypothetical protein